jgi:hypothetical protein
VSTIICVRIGDGPFERGGERSCIRNWAGLRSAFEWGKERTDDSGKPQRGKPAPLHIKGCGTQPIELANEGCGQSTSDPGVSREACFYAPPALLHIVFARAMLFLVEARTCSNAAGRTFESDQRPALPPRPTLQECRRVGHPEMQNLLRHPPKLVGYLRGGDAARFGSTPVE